MIKNVRILILLAVLCIIYRYGYRVYFVSGDSMDPSLQDKSLVLVDKLSYDFEKPQIGDIVVIYDFEYDDFLIKRVLAVEGESVQIIDGDIYINGGIYRDSFTHDKIGVYSFTGENILAKADEPLIMIPEDCVWVMGDNRKDTWYGIVHVKDVIGSLKN